MNIRFAAKAEVETRNRDPIRALSVSCRARTDKVFTNPDFLRLADDDLPAISPISATACQAPLA